LKAEIRRHRPDEAEVRGARRGVERPAGSVDEAEQKLNAYQVKGSIKEDRFRGEMAD
jgi:hypothetical protein